MNESNNFRMSNYKKFRLNTSKLIILTLIILAGCKGPGILSPKRAPRLSTEKVLQRIEENQPEYQWMSARFSGNANWEGRSQNISGTLRIQKDQAIFVSIAPLLGIEVARALVTPDSVKIVNRLESTYYLGNINILNRMFNTDVDFYMLQALFMGNDFPHFRNDQFTLMLEEEILRLHAARRMRNGGTGNPINQAIILEPEHLRIRSNTILDENSGRALRADYKNWENVEGRWIPTELEIQFSDERNISNLEMKYNRITLNEPQRMQFSVPSRYTPIYLTD